MTIAKKIRGLSKKKIMITVISVFAIIGLGGTVYASQIHKKMSDAQSIVDKKQNTLKNLKVELQRSFDTKDKEFLAENVTKEQVTTLRKKYKQAVKKVESLSVDTKKLKLSGFSNEKNDCKNLLAVIENKFLIQDAINHLYQSKDKSAALNGSKVTWDLEIVDDLKIETIKDIKKEHLQDTKETTFDKTVIELVNNAENQVTQIDTAKKAVAKIYKDNQVISTDSKLYGNAKFEIDKIKNVKAKKSLSDELAKVEVEIDKKAKETEEKQMQEAQKVGNEENNITQQSKTDNGKDQTAQETNNVENTQTNNQNDNSSSENYVPQDNGGSQQSQPSTAGDNTGGQGSTGDETPPPVTGGGNTDENGSANGGSTAPQGAVGPFGSRDEAIAWAMANTDGYGMIEFEGKWYVYPN